MKTAEFDYALPEELIAQHPAAERGASRLLHLNGANGAIEDLRFADFPRLISPSDLVVLNDTRVIKARCSGARRPAARSKVFVERIVAEREALALMRSGHPPHPGVQAHRRRWRRGRSALARGRSLPAALFGAGRGGARALRQRSAPALHPSPGRRNRCGALPDGVRGKGGSGRRTHCGTALRSSDAASGT
jgi:hypothetical protein